MNSGGASGTCARDFETVVIYPERASHDSELRVSDLGPAPGLESVVTDSASSGALPLHSVEEEDEPDEIVDVELLKSLETVTLNRMSDVIARLLERCNFLNRMRQVDGFTLLILTKEAFTNLRHELLAQLESEN